MTSYLATATVVRPETLLIRQLLRLYIAFTTVLLVTGIVLSQLLHMIVLLPIVGLACWLARFLPYQYSWFQQPFIKLETDHFSCASWHFSKVAYQDIVEVEALPHRSTSFLVQWFLPYWPGCYRLSVTLKNGVKKRIDLSPIDHQQRLKFYYTLLQNRTDERGTL